MRKSLFILFSFVSGCASFLFGEEVFAGDSEYRVPIEKVSFEFADKKTAAKILSSEDDWSLRIGPVDCAMSFGDSKLSKADFLKKSGKSALNWTSEEKEVMETCITSAVSKIKASDMLFPSKIFIIKTDGKEEFDTEYTRGFSSIIFPKSKFDDLIGGKAGEYAKVEDTFIHELFHIYSKNNPETREKLYQVIGFHECQEVSLPDSVADLKLTNPDAPKNNHYFNGIIDGKDVKVMPFILVRDDYRKMNLQDREIREKVIYFIFIGAEEKDGKLVLSESNGKPVKYLYNEVSNYLSMIGLNTTYFIHPEEILADNFVFMLNPKRKVNSPEILSEIRKILGFPPMEPLNKKTEAHEAKFNKSVPVETGIGSFEIPSNYVQVEEKTSANKFIYMDETEKEYYEEDKIHYFPPHLLVGYGRSAYRIDNSEGFFSWMSNNAREESEKSNMPLEESFSKTKNGLDLYTVLIHNQNKLLSKCLIIAGDYCFFMVQENYIEQNDELDEAARRIADSFKWKEKAIENHDDKKTDVNTDDAGSEKEALEKDRTEKAPSEN